MCGRGRAPIDARGRARAEGKVIVQSYLPSEPAIELACQHDYEGFARGELMKRQRCPLPPYQRLARIIMRDRSRGKLEAAARRLRSDIDQLKDELQAPLQVRGPFPAVIARLEKYHRWQILLQGARAEPLQQFLAELRGKYLAHPAVQVVVDVDPINLM